MENRDETIDLIKGIGIFFMVAGHCGAPFTGFIYLFHMALFFICSGYCYKSSYSENQANVGVYMKRKIKSLWVPFVLWTAIFSFLHNFFLKINIYTDNPQLLYVFTDENTKLTSYWSMEDMMINVLKSFLLHGGTEMGGALWFLATLLEISVAYCAIDYCIRNWFGDKYRVKIQAIVSVIFLCVGYMSSLMKLTLYGLDKVFSFYCLFFVGYTLKEYRITNRKIHAGVHVVLGIGSFILLEILKKIGFISLAYNTYVNPVFLLVASGLGGIFVFELTLLISRIKIGKQIVLVMGRNTMAVVILHFLCFKIVSLFGVLYFKDPLFYLAAFPVTYTGGIWWIAYLSIGLAVPILLSVLIKTLLCHISRN